MMLGTLWMLLACAHRPRGEWVRSVSFEGNEVAGIENPNNDVVLRDALDQPVGGHATLVSPRQELSRLDRDVLQEDALRVETLYAHHGHFDAEVDGWVVVRKNTKKRQKPVDLIGYVSPGQPSIVHGVVLEGIPKGPLKDLLYDYIDLEVGDTFELEPYTAGVEAIRYYIQDQGFAYARVTSEVRVDPVNHTVDVVLQITPGPLCKIGKITIVGDKNVPEEKLDLAIKEGDKYHLRTLEETRRKLFSLRVFQLVNVIPDLSDPTRTDIPIRIEVRESKSRSAKLGISAGYETGRLSTGASARFENWNLFHQLWTLEQEVFAGVGITTTAASSLEEGLSTAPIYATEGTLTFPRFPVSGFSFINTGRISQDLQPGYQIYEMTYAPSLAYVGFSRHRLRFGYRLSFTNKVFLDESAENERVLLSVLEQQWTYDGRNDPFQPTAGWYFDAQLAEAGLGGDYAFVRTFVEGRVVRSIITQGWTPGIVVAARLGGGVVGPLPWAGGLEGIPLEERMYMGGATTVRGWPYRGFGLIDGDGVAVGGLGMAFGSIELRKKLPYGLYFVPFVDAGRLWDTQTEVGVPGILWTAGAGVRYDSIAGPIRLDLGVRLSDNPYDSDARFINRFVPSFGIGESF